MGKTQGPESYCLPFLEVTLSVVDTDERPEGGTEEGADQLGGIGEAAGRQDPHGSYLQTSQDCSENSEKCM